ncbi:hypothetical protein C8Q74DRAFT_1222547 [Fomes fomentarius]|nr:hypothetical protein C8Q74DRAFT_1222547 [Fomes fomentarius]
MHANLALIAYSVQSKRSDWPKWSSHPGPKLDVGCLVDHFRRGVADGFAPLPVSELGLKVSAAQPIDHETTPFIIVNITSPDHALDRSPPLILRRQRLYYCQLCHGFKAILALNPTRSSSAIGASAYVLPTSPSTHILCASDDNHSSPQQLRAKRWVFRPIFASDDPNQPKPVFGLELTRSNRLSRRVSGPEAAQYFNSLKPNRSQINVWNPDIDSPSREQWHLACARPHGRVKLTMSSRTRHINGSGQRHPSEDRSCASASVTVVTPQAPLEVKRKISQSRTAPEASSWPSGLVPARAGKLTRAETSSLRYHLSAPENLNSASLGGEASMQGIARKVWTIQKHVNTAHTSTGRECHHVSPQTTERDVLCPSKTIRARVLTSFYLTRLATYSNFIDEEEEEEEEDQFR